MNKAEIKAAMLKATGNPESGAIADYADVMADAVAKLLNPEQEIKKYEPAKETRTLRPPETR
jgi:hypothetical protein